LTCRLRDRDGQRGWTARGTRRARVLHATAAATAAAAAVALATFSGIAGAPLTARADEVTVSQDNMRAGWDTSEPALTPSAVSGGSFGKLFSTAVNGQVYGQPLVVGPTVIVATENDWVYGLNAATGSINWSVSLGSPWVIGKVCGDLTPNIGVTGAPVYDPVTGAVYMVAATVVNSVPAYHMYGISVSTGKITATVPIGGHPTNDSSITFNAAQQWERPGLMLLGGSVYAAFASHCDGMPFDGFVAGMNLSTHATTLWSDETGITDNGAGIWQSGGGLMSDGSGRIFVASGNGVSPAPGQGSAPPGQLAESVVRLAVQANGSLAAQDFFSPKNAPMLDAQDLDLGSGGPVGLTVGTKTYPHLLVQGNKYGRIFVLNRDNLGGREQGPNLSDAAVRTVCCFAGMWGHPSSFIDTPTISATNWTAANDFLYYQGKSDYLREMKWGVDSKDIPYLHTVATSSATFGYTTGSPVVTSNGSDPSSAIVWIIGATDGTGAGGTLYAYRAVPPSSCTSGSPCKLPPIWSAPIGTASKFSVPATDNGRIYVGTRDGTVLGFGLHAAAVAPLGGAAAASFGQAPVGAATTRHVTVTAFRKVTVSGVSASTVTAAAANAFAVGKVTETLKGSHTQLPVKLPVLLAKGDALHAPVTFTAAVPGGATGALSFATPAARLQSVSVPLSGYGTAAGLYATSSSLLFRLVTDVSTTNVPVGMANPKTINITNFGTKPQTVRSVRQPAAPFTTGNLPPTGSVLQPGQTVTVQVVFTPKRAGLATGSLTVTGSSGAAATIRLAGTAVAPVRQFTAFPAAVAFGHVRTGRKVTAIIRIANTGNQAATVVRVGKLRRPFHAVYPVTRQLPVNPGDDLKIRVTFTPRRDGRFRSSYRFTWADIFGTHTLIVPLTGAGVR